MSVALLIAYADDAYSSRFVPVATRDVFRNRWLRGAKALKLPLVKAMDPGFAVDAAHRDALVAELGQLHAWMAEHYGADDPDVARVDTLAEELRVLRFERGISVFLGRR